MQVTRSGWLGGMAADRGNTCTSWAGRQLPDTLARQACMPEAESETGNVTAD